MIDIAALYKISYGLYIVCSGDKKNGNGFISNTVFQVTSDPARFATCCNKNNFTAEFIQNYGVFSVSVLDINASSDIIGTFGYKTGRNFDKLAGKNIKYGDTNVPIVLDGCLAYFECKVVQTIDTGTHLLFIGDLLNAEALNNVNNPLTYSYYREVRKGIAPKNAPTYIDKSKYVTKQEKSIAKKYKCPACGYIYDDAAESVRFEELPGDWICPICGSEKSDFFEID